MHHYDTEDVLLSKNMAQRGKVWYDSSKNLKRTDTWLVPLDGAPDDIKNNETAMREATPAGRCRL